MSVNDTISDVHDDESSRQVRYGYYFIAFIDLVGQRQRLERVREVQWDNPEEAKQRLQSAAGPVRRVRRAFANYFSAAARTRQQSDLLTPEQLAEFSAMRQLTFLQTGFSDSFVVSIPLSEQPHGRAPAALAVWAALYGIAGMSIAAMAEGVPLRGGIDVGFGVDMFRTEVFGPPLLDAYKLECDAAQYPRVLAGEGLPRYLGYLMQPKASDGKWARLIASTAEDCRQLIIHAPDDHRPMLHMLSSRLLATAQFLEPARVAYKWARGQREQFKSEQNFKLAGYYQRLVGYFDTAGIQIGHDEGKGDR